VLTPDRDNPGTGSCPRGITPSAASLTTSEDHSPSAVTEFAAEPIHLSAVTGTVTSCPQVGLRQPARATTWLELAQAEPGRLSARPGVYLMTSHVPTSDWHCGQTANCCHRQLRAADACLTAQVARHPRSRISDGMELAGPLRLQALRARHGYWLAASWRLETRPGRCESSTFDVHGRRWDRWRSRRSASRYELAGELAASPC
jgi:hypothetical protein